MCHASRSVAMSGPAARFRLDDPAPMCERGAPQIPTPFPTLSKEPRMNRNVRWLALAAMVAVIGCQESKPEGSASTQATGSSTSSPSASTTTTSGTSATATTPAPVAGGQEVTMPSGLKYQDVEVGTGAEASTGKSVTLNYTGRLTDGTQFDSSVGKAPLVFQVGAGTMVRGMEEGVVGMKVGGKRKLTIPPQLGYGERGYPGAIPPNATILFDIELLDVK
jgi:FKBP-type peptidyl-prolyl cis-trans isomerase